MITCGVHRIEYYGEKCPQCAMSEPTSTAAGETAEQVARPIAKWILTTGGPTTVEDITGRIAAAIREATAPLQTALAELTRENERLEADSADYFDLLRAKETAEQQLAASQERNRELKDALVVGLQWD